MKTAGPTSSVLHKIAKHFKHWRLKYIYRQDSFYSCYFMKTKISLTMYNISRQKLLLSGDVELNPGPVPVMGNVIQSISFDNPDFVLHYRMLRYGLQPLDVGGEEDCLF